MDFKLGLFHTAPTDFAKHHRHTRGAYKEGVHGRAVARSEILGRLVVLGGDNVSPWSR